MKIIFSTLTLMFSVSAFAQNYQVKIVDQKDSETEYNYIVPGYSTSQSTASATCYGTDSTVNCSGSGTTDTYSLPAHSVSYRVRGATFSLQLPDGRIAVVNCESKFKERFVGPAGNHRSCKRPLVDDINVDFHGDKAKLEWVVSLDGKKKDTETYKILAVLPKTKSGAGRP